MPTCNGMMRNIYPTSTPRGYPYPSPGGMNTMQRYPQMGATYPPVAAQFSGMSSMPTPNMSTMPRQMQQLSMATDYNVNLVSNMMVRADFLLSMLVS